MAYQDIYRLLSWMAMGMEACAFILSKNKPGQGAPARRGHALATYLAIMPVMSGGNSSPEGSDEEVQLRARFISGS
jgi:hypothetical protein